LSGDQTFRKISLLSERADIIRFVENACETVDLLSVFSGKADIDSVIDNASLTLFDAALFQDSKTTLINRISKNYKRVICILSKDLPASIGQFAEFHFTYIVSFPLSIQNFRICILRFQNLLNNSRYEISPLSENYEDVPKSFFGNFCGKSEIIRDVRKRLLKVSCTQEPVLLLGETGTGKTTAAQVIHLLSDKKNKKLVYLPLSTVVETLAGSTFFGHAKGSFTNADSDSRGILEAADGSTLFFDEVGTASLDMQAMLLTVIETGVYKKVGAVKELHTNARFIFATNADLNKMLKEGRFRSDLYFRICDNVIRIPAIRERKEDIIDIVDNYIKKKNFTITLAALERLESYNWPGNIRELQKCLSRAMESNLTQIISEKDIDFGNFNFPQ